MWLGRRWQNARAWFARRSRPVRASLGCAGLFVLLSAPCWCGCGGSWLCLEYQHWFMLTAEDRSYRQTQRAIYPNGLPSVSRQLKAEMEPIPDPDTALRLHPDWAALRLPNGEWVFGCGISSHGHLRLGRGTQVVKDSRGHVRIFFGDVLGDNFGIEAFRGAWYATSLDDFYHQLQNDLHFREWVPDQ